MCRRPATPSAAIQSVSVHCAAEHLPYQPRYKVSKSTVPQSTYSVSRDTKCLSPMCRRAPTPSAAIQNVPVHCAAEHLPRQQRYKASQSNVPQSIFPISRDTSALVHCAAEHLPYQPRHKRISPLCRRASFLSAATQVH
jgi:hypothetical protein